MTLPFDPGEDFAAVVDNLTTVRYYPRTSARGFGDTSYAVTAHKSEIDKSKTALPGLGSAPDDTCVWNLLASDMPAVEAKIGDRIVEILASGTQVNWIIDSVDIKSWQTRYRLTCTREKAGAG